MWKEQKREGSRVTIRFAGTQQFSNLLWSPTYVSSSTLPPAEDSEVQSITFWERHTQMQMADGNKTEMNLERWT